jgi:hypothetical protein
MLPRRHSCGISPDGSNESAQGLAEAFASL